MARGQSTAKYAAVASFWGIAADVKTAQAKWEARPSSVRAPAPADYLVRAKRAGADINLYPAWDQASTVKAAQAFFADRAKLPLEWREQAALNVLAKVAEYEALLPANVDHYIHQAAGLAEPTRESLELAIVKRANARTKLDAVFVKVAESIVEIAQDPELLGDAELVKTAMVALEETDGALSADVRRSIGLPEESLVNLDLDMVKTAEDEIADHVTLQNGRTVKVSSISAASLAVIDPELAKMSHDTLVDVLPTLPRPDADLLVRLNG